jgi:hypothetical protein
MKENNKWEDEEEEENNEEQWVQHKKNCIKNANIWRRIE